MRATRIKICGIKEPQQARSTAYAGADAIGFVRHPASPRHIELVQAAQIRAALPPFVSLVAVLVNPSHDEVLQVITQVQPDILQFHGDEEEAFCRSFNKPYIKAIKARSRSYISEQASLYSSAQALLLDSYSPQQAGGTGIAFDHSIIPSDLKQPLIISGGLSVDNVASIIQEIRPYGVDVSSGVESMPGKKDSAKINSFISAVLSSR